MSESRLLIALLALGGSVSLLVIVAYLLHRSTPVPDRRWHDRPPALWRASWPVVLLIAHRIAGRVPPSIATGLQRTLRQAGLGFALEPAEFLAGRAVCAILGAVAGAIAASAVGSAGVGAVAGAAAGWLLLGSWLADRAQRRLKSIARALPFYLDLVTLSVESGANLTGALAQGVDRGPAGPLRDELSRVLSDIRAGRTRAEALRAMGDRIGSPAVTSWVSALVVSDRYGSGLGTVLRAQAEQRRQERFQLAEKMAMRAPVKMLFPLLVFIFPCTFVLLFFPIVIRLLEEGIL
jgi:tight adherence protein C